MKKSIMFVICLSIFMLSACGDDYDDEIDEVIKLENEQLNEPSMETDIDKLNREDTQIWVYDDGKYIEIEYVIRGRTDTTSPVYKHSDDKYVRHSNGDFRKGEIDDLETDYTENVDDNS